jgi:hypothetical protein
MAMTVPQIPTGKVSHESLYLTLNHFDYSPEFGLKIPGIVIESAVQSRSLILQTFIETIE